MFSVKLFSTLKNIIFFSISELRIQFFTTLLFSTFKHILFFSISELRIQYFLIA